MDPQAQFCHNPDCPARGQAGCGNIHIHSRAQRRYRCTTCGRPSAAAHDTPFSRLKEPTELVTLVLTLLCRGCPLQAIVAAFGLDERTIASWQVRAGRHGQRLHEHYVLQGLLELVHVQADEVWAKRVGGRLRMAMAMAVPSRLWLGGVISPHRDPTLIPALVRMVRAAARSRAILVCVDGLASYVTAFTRVFRHALRPGRRGRPRLRIEPGLLIGQVVKQYARRHIVGVVHRVVRGTAAAITAVLKATGTGTTSNTAYIERLNATFRSSLAALTRRGRALAPTEAVRTAGMYLVGCAYNSCWNHESLRVRTPDGAGLEWQQRTPAMAAGLTARRWRMHEWLAHPIPLPPWVAPKRRGRPPEAKQPSGALAA